MNSALHSALSGFQVLDGELVMGGRKVTEITREHGSPLYIYDRSVLKRRARTLNNILPNNLHVLYAVKANPNLAIIAEMEKYYDGFDVASAGEFTKILQAGVDPAKVNFAGPGKTVEELEHVISRNIGSISIENSGELQHCIRLCATLQKTLPLIVRVNPEFELSGSGIKMGGGPRPFGIDSEQVPGIIDLIKESDNVRFEGLHIFAGSQNLSADQLEQTFENILQYAVAFQDVRKVKIKTLNMGGGFGIPLYAHDNDLDITAVGKALTSLLHRFTALLPGTKFIIELGRFLIAESGVYVSKILYKKESRGQIFLITDGGMHHHLAASGNLGQSIVRRPMPLVIANKMNGPRVKVHVVGPLCTPLDTFGYVELTEADEGDIVAVLNSGAYGLSASPIHFLSHPLPREVII